MSAFGEEGKQVSIAVSVSGFIYAAEGFAVVETYDEEGRRWVLVGDLDYLHPGERIEVEGELVYHPKYGPQVKVARLNHPRPAGKEGVIAALAAVRHIGRQGAELLYARYGEKTLEQVEADPERVLGEIPGIGAKRLPEAVASWREQREERQLRVFLAEAGLDGQTAGRIRRAWGKRPVGRLLADPYALLELPGVGFITADRLGRAVGIAANHPKRLAAALLHALSQAELNGHCYLPRPELERQAVALLAKTDQPAAREAVGAALERLLAEGSLIADGEEREAIYEAGMHATESSLALQVRALATAGPHLDHPGPARTIEGFTPTPEQWLAVERAVSHRLSLLTGGPGTGKTACLRAVVALAKERGYKVRLCAPTGKAARRLAAATGEEALTVHRLLEWQPPYGFARNAANRLEGIELLVVDEASMLSLRLADALFAAVGSRCHVLLVGDSDQLPAIGPGRVLEDLIDSGLVPVSRLTEIFRQARRSLIVQAAHAINAGSRPRSARAEDQTTLQDFYLLTRDDEAALHDELLSLVCTRLPDRFGFDPLREILVLSPWHRGAVGIDQLNRTLRSLLNPNGRRLPVPGVELCVGDRIIQTRNDYDHELMNGEVAVIRSYGDRQGEDEEEKVVIELEDGNRRQLPLAALYTFEPAYAISIHKAQGSQAPAVVVVITKAQRIMLTRNLLYTAVTRAERLCLLLAEPGALELALRHREGHRRYTLLAKRLRAAAELRSAA